MYALLSAKENNNLKITSPLDSFGRSTQHRLKKGREKSVYRVLPRLPLSFRQTAATTTTTVKTATTAAAIKQQKHDNK